MTTNQMLSIKIAVHMLYNFNHQLLLPREKEKKEKKKYRAQHKIQELFIIYTGDQMDWATMQNPKVAFTCQTVGLGFMEFVEIMDYFSFHYG